MSKNYILLLNYKRWQDSLECLESVWRLNTPNTHVVLVDNPFDNSQISIEKIIEWANGEQPIEAENPSLNYLITPPINKPINFTYLTEVQVRQKTQAKSFKDQTATSRLTLIQAEKNKGYAAGNNLGLTYILNQNDASGIWILNTDILVEAESLNKIIKFKQQQPENIGIIGTLLLNYHQPQTIQAIGGAYNPTWATTKHLGAGQDKSNFMAQHGLIKKIDYPIGASLYIAPELLKDVKLLEEGYFLYFEELDWVLRAKKRGWDFAITLEPEIYHKEGASIGANTRTPKKSQVADYYSLRNRLLITQKYYPEKIWTVKLAIMLAIINRLKRGQFKIIPTLIKWIIKTPQWQ